MFLVSSTTKQKEFAIGNQFAFSFAFAFLLFRFCFYQIWRGFLGCLFWGRQSVGYSRILCGYKRTHLHSSGFIKHLLINWSTTTHHKTKQGAQSCHQSARNLRKSTGISNLLNVLLLFLLFLWRPSFWHPLNAHWALSGGHHISAP